MGNIVHCGACFLLGIYTNKRLNHEHLRNTPSSCTIYYTQFRVLGSNYIFHKRNSKRLQGASRNKRDGYWPIMELSAVFNVLDIHVYGNQNYDGIMNICDYTDLGQFDSCEPIDLSGYGQIEIINFVTRFECTFTEVEAEEIGLSPGTYYFEAASVTYKFTVV